MTVAIIDYGSGNLRSAAKAFERAEEEAGLNLPVVVTSDPADLQPASHIVLPGVGAFPSNGLVIVDDGTVTLVDSAWTDPQTTAIVDWVEAELDMSVTRAVLTHAHQDKMGGVGILRQRGIETYAHRLSNEVAFSKDLVPAEFDLDFSEKTGSAKLGSVLVSYPGPGHTRQHRDLVSSPAHSIRWLHGASAPAAAASARLQ